MRHSTYQSLWSGLVLGGHRPSIVPTQRLDHADPDQHSTKTPRRSIVLIPDPHPAVDPDEDIDIDEDTLLEDGDD